jgi:ABC-2 type transport system ATP-binding protein
MDDIEALCKRLIVISEGKIVSDGSIDVFRSRLRPERRVTVDLATSDETFSDDDAKTIRREGHRVYLAFDPARVSTSELTRRIIANHSVKDLYIENPPIEEIVAQLYSQQGRTSVGGSDREKDT